MIIYSLNKNSTLLCLPPTTSLDSRELQCSKFQASLRRVGRPPRHVAARAQPLIPRNRTTEKRSVQYVFTSQVLIISPPRDVTPQCSYMHARVSVLNRDVFRGHADVSNCHLCSDVFQKQAKHSSESRAIILVRR